MDITAGLVILMGSITAVAAATTAGLVGLARLERAAVRVPVRTPPRRG